MARFVSRNSRRGFLSVFWEQLSSLDPFTKMFLVIAILIVGVTPYFLNNYQTVSQHASTCVPGTGTTSVSCGGNYTGPMCNGTTCATQGYYCSGGNCVKGWAGGKPATGCNPVCGSGPTPTRSVTPTPITSGSCTSGYQRCGGSYSGGFQQCNSGNWANYSCPSGYACSVTGTNKVSCLAVKTPTPATSTTCTPGYGSTNTSCGDHATAACNGYTCMIKSYYCSAGKCVYGWTGQATNNCSPGCGPTPTPATCSVYTCNGSYYACSGSTGYQHCYYFQRSCQSGQCKASPVQPVSNYQCNYKCYPG